MENRKDQPVAEHDAADDQIIAKAFKYSLLAISVAVMIAGLIWIFLNSTTAEVAVVEDKPLIKPQTINVNSQLSPPKVNFTNITLESGIQHSHVSGARGERMLPETMGGGIAVLDYNNDKLPDLLFVSGNTWPWDQAVEPKSNQHSLILYQGDGTGNFSDVTTMTGLNIQLQGMGAAVGDFDNDGYIDIFVTAVGSNRLFKNINGRRFEEVTEKAGVNGDTNAWSTGSAFLDYDRDGDLDLMVLNYVRWSREIDLQADYQLTGIGRAYGPPAQFAGTNSFLYRNDGNGTFTDVSADSGIQIESAATGLPVGKGLALLPTDVDNDGWVDVVVANDMVRNFLFLNQKGQGFAEFGVENGVAFDNTGIATGAMGIDDVLFGDTKEHAIAIGNFGNEMTSLYVRPPDTPVYTDQAIVTGVGPASRRAVTFGLFFFDYDLDGRDDLLQANGHIENEINTVEPGQNYAQQPQLFWNCGLSCNRQFSNVRLDAQNGLFNSIVGRGAAYADIDLDGDLDVVLTQIDDAPVLLRNDQNTNHNWIQFVVNNQFGAPDYGAQVEIITGESSQHKIIQPTRSYLSQVEAIAAFGVAEQTNVSRVHIHWSNGEKLTIENPQVNMRHYVRAEPKIN